MGRVSVPPVAGVVKLWVWRVLAPLVDGLPVPPPLPSAATPPAGSLLYTVSVCVWSGESLPVEKVEGTQVFAGTINRLAFWADPGSTPIANIADTATQALFADSTAIKSPALSRGSLGQPLVDFAGNAAAYNSGTHTGSLGAFIPTGSFG